ncbi:MULTISPECIES: immune inhibitor A domain-containing protein [unclassified Bacillus (in: firmicutes)]|uniref:immune inhibitor A domain-containing protein n=1 Tax=unclassified Bacillus (in: firmicutes) TaxID=185979 RepID=UPI0008EB9150|nr:MULTISPECIES: immune inhibitor A domain-containing protein [unclassified Bacillus (in: firmicutes)]SFB19785.1 immune inhibitor A [Bacillus sp. UNCCL13]SFQ90745.1 antibacterial peptide protease. Metallo peptidase. MEROPS family M06 [Bacillus sp. cl95]
MKKLLKTGLTSAVIAGTLFSGFPGNFSVQNGELHKNTAAAATNHYHGSLDLSIVNEDKLLESLIERGAISKGASTVEKQNALNAYLEVKGTEDKSVEKDPLAAKVKAAEAEKQQKFKDFNNGLLNGKGNKNGHLKGNPDPVQEGTSPGVVKKGKLLTLMVEFSDFEHNNLKPDETDNYYPDYNQEHFEDMIFGDKGEYKGPNGEDQVSQKTYYEEQSGGTYTIEGQAYGWLKVPGTAKYYGADKASGGHDNVTPGGSKQLVVDVYAAAKAAGVPLDQYDLEDSHDLDGDGNVWEPDGLVDHLQIIHSGMGQEAGGGSLGDDAIWSHRSAKFVDPDGLGKGVPGFYDYTMMPEDGATGVFAHEYGHDLGLPDEYDTQYTGTGEAVGYWSIMASGSWAGKIPGAEPTGFSPWAKQYFQSTLGGKWTNPTVVNWDEVSTKGTSFLLDQANSPLGKNNQAVRVNLPGKKTFVNKPASGSYEFWGGQQDEIDTNMVTDVDLTGKNSATLTFDAWYDTEEQWDFAFAQVSTDGGATWKSLGNDNTRSDVVAEGYPTILNSMPGFTGKSDGWEPQSFDLSQYKGQKIKLRLRYATDWGTSHVGFFADNLKVVADGATLVEDGGEAATTPFKLNGFTKMDGNKLTNHYYLLEWRNHKGVDLGLANIKRGESLMKYDGGLVVWYVDDSFTDNWTGAHPGDGYLGVVDAHLGQDLLWNTGAEASTRYHIADAAFGLNPTSGLNLDYPGVQTLTSSSLPAVSLFDDSKSYLNTFMPDAGRNIGHFGLKVRVNGQSTDKSVGSIVIYK